MRAPANGTPWPVHVQAEPGQAEEYDAGRQATEAESEVASAMSGEVLELFPAGSPRGSWPAEEFAAQRRAEGQEATVVMDLEQDAFLVVVPAAEDE
jgi:hypothetical protein